VRIGRCAEDNWFDVWYPELSPKPESMAEAKSSQTDSEWSRFVRHFRKQMSEPAATRTLDLLSVLSQNTNFSLGCYCEHEDRCHRSVLIALVDERGASLV
jgi:uncharacterized protein YeaO (DUF488 family)